MEIIHEVSENQFSKIQGELSQEDLVMAVESCQGECYDCDGCGGSITH